MIAATATANGRCKRKRLVDARRTHAPGAAGTRDAPALVAAVTPAELVQALGLTTRRLAPFHPCARVSAIAALLGLLPCSSHAIRPAHARMQSVPASRRQGR
jgi:hypothetical protein